MSVLLLNCYSWDNCIPTPAGETGQVSNVSCHAGLKKKQETSEVLSRFNFECLYVAQVHVCLVCFWGFLLVIFFPHLVICLCCVVVFSSTSEMPFGFEIKTVLCLYSSWLMSSNRLLSCSYLGAVTGALLDYRHYRQHCWAKKAGYNVCYKSCF